MAALLAPLGIGGLLAGGAAPVVLGTLFGVGGGGLAGRRVRERWRGVEEFGFVEIGDGTKATVEEMEDLHQAKKKIEARKAEEAKEREQEQELEGKQGKDVGQVAEKLDDTHLDDKKPGDQVQESGKEGEMSEAQANKEVEADQAKLEEKLLDLSLKAGTRSSVSGTSPTTARASLDSPRPSLDHPKEEKSLTDVKKPPSLTVSIHGLVMLRLRRRPQQCSVELEYS
jgi:hypothetical protein